jgi:glycosyltransferase involved in cell wall biosynthesis
VHAAADVQVLSFAAGWDLDSGVLGDAIAWGLPVVCSSGNQTAAEVERLGIGRLFEPASVASLRDALLALPDTVGADVWDAARAEWSGAANAAAHLALLDSLGS